MTKIPKYSLRELESAVAASGTNVPLLVSFGKCLSSHGCFYLFDCDVCDSDYEALCAVTLRFFSDATEEERAKMTVKDKSVRRGFLALENESTAKSTNTGVYSDYLTAFSMGDHSNVFPNAEFEAAWTSLYKRVSATAIRLLEIMLQMYGIKRMRYDNLLRCRLYPDVPKDRAAEFVPLRVAAHNDTSLITLIHQTPCANGFVSLQGTFDGAFVDIPTVPDTHVVQIGSVLSVLSNGRLLSAKHQIAAPPLRLIEGSARTATVFHVRPTPDELIPVATAHRLGVGDKLRGTLAPFGEWLGGIYVRIHKPEEHHQEQGESVKSPSTATSPKH